MESRICADSDSSFGPVVPSECRGGFDFTILFEDIFFSLLPTITLLLAAPVRLSQLSRGNKIVSRTLLQLGKQCTTFSHAIVRLVILIFWGTSSSFRTQLSIPTAAFNLIASLLICSLSYIEGRKSVRPSAVLNIYLLGSSILDILQLRTLWLALRYDTRFQLIAISSSVSLGLKIILLILEAIPKRTSEASISPEDVSGIYSLRTFWWLNRILWLGRCKRLEPIDLFSIDKKLSAARYSSQLSEAWNKVDKDYKYALLSAVFSTLKWPLLTPAFPRLILIGFTYAQPLLIKRALNFVDESGPQNIGYGLIGATFLVYGGLAIFNGYYGHLLYRSITIARGSLIDIIYSKSLRIELTSAEGAAPAGLITADIERIGLTIEKIHSLWASVIELGIAIFLLEIEMGWACIAPVIVALICTFSTSLVAKALPRRQKRWNQAMQERVALTSTMLSDMKTVKMMGLSRYISSTLQAARMAELAASKAFRQCMAFINLLVLIPKQLSAPLTFMLFALAVQKDSGPYGLSATRAFTTLTIIELITTPLGLVLQTIPSATSSLACLDRIQTYLKLPDKIDRSGGTASSPNLKMFIEHTAPSSEKLTPTEEGLPILSLRKATFAYKNAGSSALNSMSFTVSRGCITMVIGPIGSGKSSLLKSILGELELRTGELDVRTARIAYCDQRAWIPNGTIRGCIIGMMEFDKSWFDEVVHVCVLDEDISSLADGFDTKVGSRGIALSEGQKQRLTLARAIFSRAPLLILDDIFSSLDSRTETILSQRLLSCNGLLKRCGLTAVLTTHSMRHLPEADQIIVLDNGSCIQIGSFQDLNRDGTYLQNQPIPQTSIEIAEFVLPSDNKEENVGIKQTDPGKKPINHETHLTEVRNQSVYTFYLKPIGPIKLAILLVAVIILAFLTRFQRVWIQWWTEAHDGKSMYIGVLFLLAVGACLTFAFFFWWMWMVVVPATAGSLHEQLLDSIICAPISYFTTVDSGIVLNRFSQDMAIINGPLPVNIFQAISILMICLIQIAFIAYGSKYMATAIPGTLIVVSILSRFYLLTSQQLRLLDLELKAPIYTSLTETKEGLATIRAFGWQPSYKLNLQAQIDESNKAVYLLFMIQRWLNFVLDLIVAGLATLLMTLATQLRQSTDAAILGIGLSSIIGFSINMSQFIVCYTELENSLGAISRIKDCVQSIKAEDSSLDAKKPPNDWPGNGAVEFRGVTALYNDYERAALKEISFKALPGQKICICGRTGSGKSTLLLVMLRILDIKIGSVYLDDIDISTLSSETVRQNINVIPQSPFFIPGSIRLNLLADTRTDEDMIAALKKTGLWELVATRGGLEAEISTIALSRGQQQLFCLAAAMLKKSKIVLIDEVTSGVDNETERIMSNLIKEEFRNCTVISIVHRLKMANDYNLVIVLAHGVCVEKGEPSTLLEMRGEFWKLMSSSM